MSDNLKVNKTDKAILTCALTGVLTNPKQHPVPVTPAQMAAAAREAYDAGASIMHVHLRRQEPGMGAALGHLATIQHHQPVERGLDMWREGWVAHAEIPLLSTHPRNAARARNSIDSNAFNCMASISAAILFCLSS